MGDRPEWVAPEGYQSEMVMTARVGTYEIGTTATITIRYADPRRREQRRTRRVRMARKRRRGW